MSRICLFNKNDKACHSIVDFLAGSGFDVCVFGCLDEFMSCASLADIVVVDIGSSDVDGVRLVSNLRAQFPLLGIIVITRSDSADEKLEGFSAGADYSLVKPLSLPELWAVTKALLRRVGSLDAWELKLRTRLLQAPEGQQSILSASELAIFRLFAEHVGEVVSRRQIVEAMGYNWLDYDLRRLDTLISRLRRRWREQLGLELPLRTEHRDGYSFCAPLRCTL